jgi:hypothetical protein
MTATPDLALGAVGLSLSLVHASNHPSLGRLLLESLGQEDGGAIGDLHRAVVAVKNRHPLGLVRRVVHESMYNSTYNSRQGSFVKKEQTVFFG